MPEPDTHTCVSGFGRYDSAVIAIATHCNFCFTRSDCFTRFDNNDC